MAKTPYNRSSSHVKKAWLVSRRVGNQLNYTISKYSGTKFPVQGVNLKVDGSFVFDGNGGCQGYGEGEKRDPINYYGLSKARGEEAVEAMKGPWQIVRTSWLFGDGVANFPKTMRRLLSEKPSLKVVNDQRGCPTHADDLARILGFLVSSGCGGIFHATNAGQCTWFELACEVARLLHVDKDHVEACPSSEYPTAAKRPACSVLQSSRLEAVGCPQRASWQDAVARYIMLLESGQARHP